MLESMVRRQSETSTVIPTVGTSDDAAAKTTATLRGSLGVKNFASQPTQALRAVERMAYSINSVAKVIEDNSNKITEAITTDQKAMFLEFFKELRLSSTRGDNISPESNENLYKRLAQLEASGGNEQISAMIKSIREELVPHKGFLGQAIGELKRQFIPGKIEKEHFREGSFIRRAMSNPAAEYGKHLEAAKRQADASKILAPLEEKLGLDSKKKPIDMFPEASNGKNFRTLPPPPPAPKRPEAAAIPDKALVQKAAKGLQGLGLDSKEAKAAAEEAIRNGATGVEDIIRKALQKRDKSTVTNNRPEISTSDKKTSIADAVQGSVAPVKPESKMDWSFMDDNTSSEEDESPYKEEPKKTTGRDAKGRFIKKPRGGLAAAEELVQLGPKEKVVRPRGPNGQYLPTSRGGLAGLDTITEDAPSPPAEAGIQKDETSEKILGTLEKIEQHTDPDTNLGTGNSDNQTSGVIASKLGSIGAALAPLAGIAAVLGVGALAGYAINKAGNEALAAQDVAAESQDRDFKTHAELQAKLKKIGTTQRDQKALELKIKAEALSNKTTIQKAPPTNRANNIERATAQATPAPSTPDSVPTSISNQSVSVAAAAPHGDTAGVRPNDNSFIRFQDKRWTRSA